MSFTVFLGNLPAWVTADDIKGWLTAENLVADAIKVIRNPETQESKGFAFIEAPNADEMNSVIRRFDRAPLLNVAAEIEDFVDTMAVVAALDLVVTVDTSVAHLAGAMGRPVWILLPYAPDWRWLLDRSDSPWYPSARLFRQWSPGDWDGLARQVAQALSAPGSVAAAESAPRRDR